ncbi:MAG: MBL fold metallo-hydrolase [Candidatus Omnitrophica bacterium]|nr:MBL fold metallo-hydrolase [Candidatus Omnitrophota bacterium]
MYVKVLYDAEARRGLLSGKGFSCLIDGKILFDTAEGPNDLVENMDRLMVDLNDIEGVVISHDHYDHTGGLWEVLRRKKGLKVYACPSFSDTFKQCVEELGGELVFVDKPMEISKGIFTTGEMESLYKEEYMPEQALYVKGDKGVSIITGCAHPGILNILTHIKKTAGAKHLYMVFGGFHLDGMDRESIGDIITGFKKLGVEKAGPTHCSGTKARRIFSGQYHDNFIPVKAGHIIHL